MASLAPDSSARVSRRGELADRAALAGVVLAGLATAGGLLYLLGNLYFAAGFAVFFVAAAALVGFAWRRSAAAAEIEPAGTDRALLRAGLDATDRPLALTDRDGKMVAANAGFEALFPGAPVPPGLDLDESEAEKLHKAGLIAWRDGGDDIAGLKTPRGAVDARIVRAGNGGDYLLWRFEPTSGGDMVLQAEKLLDGSEGAILGEAGVMGALVDARGVLIAANPVFRTRALGDVEAKVKGRDITGLLVAGEDRLIRIAAEGEGGTPLRIVQVPLPTGSADGDPLLFFLLDELAVPGGAADADQVHALLAMLPLGLALAERDGRLLFMNKAFRQAAGLSEDDDPLYPGDLVVDEDKTAVANAVRRFANSASISADIALRLKHQPEETVAMTVAGAPGLGDAAVLLSLKDNSEDEKLKRQVAQATKMQAVGQLAGGVAHDFNNILTAIIGHCDLMLLRHAPGDSDYDDIQQIKANSNRAANLTRQLLAFSRQQTLRLQIVQLPDIVSEVSNLLKRLLGETITLSVHHGRNLGPVRADPGQLEQVIVNLAVNARDAMQARGDEAGESVLTLRTFAVSPEEADAIAGDIMPPAEYTALSVTDTGVGIRPEALPKIFEPFYTTKEVGKGTGLGLSTVYGIVKQSGGYIFADSEIGRGTTFTLYLPVHRGDGVAAASDAPKATAATAPAEIEAQDWGSGTILVVEDEDMVRTVAERALQRQGYQVVTARDGEEALEIVGDRQDFDLVLSDVVMPGMDGPAMAEKMRDTMPDVPILFMSGYAEEQLRKSIDIARVHFLPKPFSVEQLGEAVQGILRKRGDGK